MTAAMHALPVLVWGVIAWETWRFVLVRRPAGTMPLIIALLSTLFVVHYGLHALVELTPTQLGGTIPWLHVTSYLALDKSVVMTVPLLRHLVYEMAPVGPPPSRRWLMVNYGSGAVVMGLSVLSYMAAEHAGARAWLAASGTSMLYTFGMIAATMPRLARLARRGLWRPGRLIRLSSADLVVVVVALAGLSTMMAILWLTGRDVWGIWVSGWSLLLHTAVGLAFALPFVVRMLGQFALGLVVAGATLAASAAAYLGAHALASRAGSAEAARLFDLAGILGLALLLGPGRAALRAGVARLLFRRRRLRRTALQEFLHTLSPELGAIECCRRALAELARVMPLEGAAILLADGETVVHGTFRIAPLACAWPRGRDADGLPTRARGGMGLGEFPPPLAEALVESDVVWVVPLVSPRGRRGSLFTTEGLLPAPLSEEEIETVEAFADQLARVLDGAALLARAVAVERSLAHAEKLAAIGELAARIAHDIRNPVTAARSLAQQLAREPHSPFAAEHALILEALERIEQRVAALLRFARREEFRFEPVDLGALVRETVEGIRPRLQAAGVTVSLEADGVVQALADREKLRQALLNLLENALDALGGTARRRLGVAVMSANGTATVRVSDSGPGVPADALPRLFEPFFTLKASGTGLGLAITKRTVDAHGGRIAASSAPGGGMTFEITLPTGGPP